MMTEHAPSADEATYAVHGRWGDVSKLGFTIVPNTLIFAQRKLGISPNEMSVLLQLLVHWWDSDRPPFVRTATVANRSGLSERAAQRAIKNLREKGLIDVVKLDGRKTYSFEGLVGQLKAVAPNYSWRRKSSSGLGGESGVQTAQASEGSFANT